MIKWLDKILLDGDVFMLSIPTSTYSTTPWYIHNRETYLTTGNSFYAQSTTGMDIKRYLESGGYIGFDTLSVDSLGRVNETFALYGYVDPPIGETGLNLDWDYPKLCIAYDDEAEEACIYLCNADQPSNNRLIGGTSPTFPADVNRRKTVYQAISTSFVPIPNFKSIAFFRDLHSHRNLSQIKDEKTNHGEIVTGATYADFKIIEVEKQPNSTISKIIGNTPVGGEVTYCFTELTNRGTIKREADTDLGFTRNYLFKYYINGVYQPSLDHTFSAGVAELADNSEWYLSFLVDTELEMARPSIIHAYDDDGIRKYDYNTEVVTLAQMKKWFTWLSSGYGFDLPPDPYYFGDDSDEGGGGGDFNSQSDNIGFADVPTFSAVSSGLVKIFTPSKSQLADLSEFLWSGLFDIDTFKKLFSDPMNCLLNLMVIPYNVPYEQGTPPNLIFGNVDTGIPMFVASSQYLTVDCGTVDINEYYGAYLDYAPYTKVNCYLPYIGIVALNTDDVMGKSLHILYKVDILTGACIATIKAGEEVLYHFSGNCGCTIPLSSNSYSSTIGSIISIATTAISVGATIASEGATAPLIAGGVASTANNVMSSKPQVARSGSLGSFAGFMDIQKPYLIFEIPSQCKAKNQQIYKGYPSHIAYKLADISGYTEIESIHLENMTCTDTELSEIESLLMTGVII